MIKDAFGIEVYDQAQLVMVLLDPTKDQSWWFIDLARPSCEALGEIELLDRLGRGSLVVLCPEAKAYAARLKLAPSPDLRWLCLHTVKKLLARDARAVAVPEFSDKSALCAWALKAATSALEMIKSAEVSPLIALECQVIMATLAMERAGLPFMAEAWREALGHYSIECEGLKARLHSILVKSSGFALFGPDPVDLNNADEVKRSLEELLGKKLSGTSQSSLKNYDHEAVKLLLRYREQARMLATYGENFLSKIENDRIHASFEPLGSASGRFACREPNLQALPSDPAFQSCIKARPPYTLLSFDYGAFELRILAALSGDQHLQMIFREGLDIHSMVAEAVFNCPVSKVQNTKLRDQAKVLNFGIVYGMGEKALSNQLNISLTAAQEMMKSYFARFKGVKLFLEQLENSALKRGFASTALGRRLYFNASEDKRSIGRIARNMPIQGTGADIAKLALCRVYGRLDRDKLKAQIVNMVHDELVVECHEDYISEVSRVVKEEMSTAFRTILPELEAEIGVSV